MDINKLKIYNKYKDIRFPNRELIYVGFNDYIDYYCFIFKSENGSFYFLKEYGFDPDKITKDLNLEIYINEYDNKFIKGYEYKYHSKETIKMYFKPILKDKLKNILNR